MSRRMAGCCLSTLLAVMFAAAAPAQVPAVRVYSEFSRIDPFGKVVTADRPARGDAAPREILSPGLARNAHATYHVAITAPPGMQFTLYIGQNPEDFLGVTVYKEIYQRQGDNWIPDALEPIELPYTTRLPDSTKPIPNQTTVAFLMDVWVPPGTEVRRTKLEPEVFVDDRWIIYPMEVRILPATIPEADPRAAAAAIGAVGQPSDATARAALGSYLCGESPKEKNEEAASSTSLTIRNLIQRNVARDLDLARAIESPPGARLMDAKKWCQNPAPPPEQGAEWYLRTRDALYRMVN